MATFSSGLEGVHCTAPAWRSPCMNCLVPSCPQLSSRFLYSLSCGAIEIKKLPLKLFMHDAIFYQHVLWSDGVIVTYYLLCWCF